MDNYKDRSIIFKEGENANDSNNRYYRLRKGNLVSNPYDHNSEEYRWWNEGYRYRDMVNDG